MNNTQKLKTIHPVVAAAAGVILGAAGAAVTAALIHEPTRKKMGNKLQDAKLHVGRTVKDLQKSSHPILKHTEDKMEGISDRIQNTQQSTNIGDSEAKNDS